MKILNKFILILLIISSNIYAQDSFMTSTGKTYSEARNSAHKLLSSQGLRIIGQNYSVDRNGNWTLLLKVRPRNY